MTIFERFTFRQLIRIRKHIRIFNLVNSIEIQQMTYYFYEFAHNEKFHLTFYNSHHFKSIHTITQIRTHTERLSELNYEYKMLMLMKTSRIEVIYVSFSSVADYLVYNLPQCICRQTNGTVQKETKTDCALPITMFAQIEAANNVHLSKVLNAYTCQVLSTIAAANQLRFYQNSTDLSTYAYTRC